MCVYIIHNVYVETHVWCDTPDRSITFSAQETKVNPRESK